MIGDERGKQLGGRNGIAYALPAVCLVIVVAGWAEVLRTWQSYSDDLDRSGSGNKYMVLCLLALLPLLVFSMSWWASRVRLGRVRAVAVASLFAGVTNIFSLVLLELAGQQYTST